MVVAFHTRGSTGFGTWTGLSCEKQGHALVDLSATAAKICFMWHAIEACRMAGTAEVILFALSWLCTQVTRGYGGVYRCICQKRTATTEVKPAALHPVMASVYCE